MPLMGTSVKQQTHVQIQNSRNEKIMKIYTFNLRHTNTFGTVQTHDAKK